MAKSLDKQYKDKVQLSYFVIFSFLVVLVLFVIYSIYFIIYATFIYFVISFLLSTLFFLLSTLFFLLSTLSFSLFTSSFPRRRESSTQIYFISSSHFYMKIIRRNNNLKFLFLRLDLFISGFSRGNDGK